MLPVLNRVLNVAGLALLLGSAVLYGAEKASSPVLTVILDFKGSHSPNSLKEMERESGQILKATGLQLEWRMLGKDPSASYSDLVVMTFNGACEYQPAAPRYDELGPLAITRTTNGEVQPFGEVDCSRVVNAASGAMSGSDYNRADLLIGRAMGRVVAHELVHMLTKSRVHGTEGVEKPALSGKQLIAASLPLSAFDIDRLKEELLVH
jgi:hypothetical protein